MDNENVDNKYHKKAGIIVGVTIIVVALIFWWIANGVINMKNKPKAPVNNKVQTNQEQIINNNINNTNSSNNSIDNSDSGNNTNTTTNNTNTNNSNNSNNDSSTNLVPDSQIEEEGENNSNTTVQDVITVPKLAGSGVFQIVDETTIGTAIEKEEIMIVASKKLLLLDSNINEVTGKQLQYVVDVLTTNSDKISLYVNEDAYNLISVGSKLRVTYKIYTNDLGVEFPVIVDAQLTE